MGGLIELHSSVESERLKELKKYGILENPPDGNLDRFTALAAQLLEVPIALISIVDSERIWFISEYGASDLETERETSICSAVIESEQMYLVEDALSDERTRNNPFVTGDFGLRFYAGVPLVTKDGHRLGTFCVMDKIPRKFTAENQRLLKTVGELVMHEIEERYKLKLALEHQHQTINTTVHDLKNPLSVMPILAEMIVENRQNPEAIDKIAKQIKQASKRMAKSIDEFLHTAGEESRQVKLKLRTVELSRLVREVITINRAMAKKKRQVINFKAKADFFVYADRRKLREIIDNLISNAIKYTPHGKAIWVELEAKGEEVVLQVKDEGAGLTKDDLRNLFRPFTSLSARPTGGEKSSGLGLSIVKNLVEAHHGKIYARSRGAGKGSSFIVELPSSQD